MRPADALSLNSSAPGENLRALEVWTPCDIPHLLGPGQADFAGRHMAAGKDALPRLDGDVDDCPVSVKLDESSAVDGP
jgi:hypothetical protein